MSDTFLNIKKLKLKFDPIQDLDAFMPKLSNNNILRDPLETNQFISFYTHKSYITVYIMIYNHLWTEINFYKHLMA